MSQREYANEARARELAIVERYQAALADGGTPGPALLAEVDALFGAHQDRAYRACLRLVGNQEKARELAQDTLLTAFSKLPEFLGECAFASWLFGNARFLRFNAVRRKGVLLVEDDVISAADPRSGALTRMRQHERKRLLAQAVRTLHPQEQEAVHLRYVERLPQDQITYVSGLTHKSGARGLLLRCRRKLHRELYQRLKAMGLGTSFIREAPR